MHSESTTALLGTYDPGRAQVIGEQGLAAGFWTSFEVRPGATGDDLIITYVPPRRRTPRNVRPLFPAGNRPAGGGTGPARGGS